MSIDDVRAALLSTLNWDHHYQVHITGGEPFLNYPLLLESTKIAVELGIPVYIETNAGWALDDATVNEKLSELRSAGLQTVLVSVSPFHAEKIPPERTLRLIRIASQIFGLGRVIIYQQQWLDKIMQFGIEKTNPLGNYVSAFGTKDTGKLFWQGYGLISGGRAGYELGHLIPKKHPAAFENDRCSYELLHAHHSHFDLYGKFIPGFCGGISLGSWRDIPNLEDEVNGGTMPPLIKILVKKGPFGLYELAAREYGYQSLPEGYAGKCHFCVDLRRHLLKKGGFDELSPIQFYEEL